MAVRIHQSKTFKTPIEFTTTGEDGKPEKMSLVAEFTRFSVPEAQELLSEGLKDIDLLRKVLVGWTLKDESGEEIPFSDESFELVMNAKGLAGLAGAMGMIFFEKNGVARAKN